MNTRPAFPPTGRQRVARLQAGMHTLRPLPRLLSEDELHLFGEAEDAGAVTVPRLLRDYLSGASCCPFQFEGCATSIHPGDEWAQPAVAVARAKRDAFLKRWDGGDLSEVVARINGAQRRAA